MYYGISELALGWFKSYQSETTHSVKVGSTLSHPAAPQQEFLYGAPQGSICGPVLFSLYTNPVSSIIQSHRSINYHFYADDTQLNNSFLTFRSIFSIYSGFTSTKCQEPWSGVQLQFLILIPCVTGHKVHQSSCERPLQNLSPF